MKVHDVEQGSIEWARLRCDIPTASRFHRIVTPARRDYSAQAKVLVRELVAGHILGEPAATIDSEWISRGKELEPEAIRYYEFHQDATVERVGFVTNDDGTVGCSPDGLVDPNGGLEIKCPAPKTHVGYLLGEDDPASITQVQGCIWVCEREWWDVLSYCPGMPPVLLRRYRDDAFIADLSAAMDRFLEDYAEARAKVDQIGAQGRIEILEEIAA